MLLCIKVLNWDRYQARDRSRHKIEHPSWLKLHHKIIRSGVWGLSPSARCVAITLLILASEQGDEGSLRIKSGQLTASSGVKKGHLREQLEVLSEIGFLEYQVLGKASARSVRIPKIREEYIREERAENLEGVSEGLKKELEKPTPRKWTPDPLVPGCIPDEAKEFINRCKGEPDERS